MIDRMHPFAHSYFEAATMSPWIAGGMGIAGAALALSGRFDWAIKGIVIEIVAILAAMIAGFVGAQSNPGHDGGYDFFGGLLWLGIGLLVVLASAVLIALCNLVASKLHIGRA